jgi:hypothetical protein
MTVYMICDKLVIVAKMNVGKQHEMVRSRADFNFEVREESPGSPGAEMPGVFVPSARKGS